METAQKEQNTIHSVTSSMTCVILSGLLMTLTLVSTVRSQGAEALTVTIDVAVDRALQRNPTLRISQEALNERHATSWQATTSLLPRLDISGTVARFDPNLFSRESFVTIDE